MCHQGQCFQLHRQANAMVIPILIGLTPLVLGFFISQSTKKSSPEMSKILGCVQAAFQRFQRASGPSGGWTSVGCDQFPERTPWGRTGYPDLCGKGCHGGVQYVPWNREDGKGWGMQSVCKSSEIFVDFAGKIW